MDGDVGSEIIQNINWVKIKGFIPTLTGTDNTAK